MRRTGGLVIIGDNEQLKKASAYLFDEGYAFNYVPKDSSIILHTNSILKINRVETAMAILHIYNQRIKK